MQLHCTVLQRNQLTAILQGSQLITLLFYTAATCLNFSKELAFHLHFTWHHSKSTLGIHSTLVQFNFVSFCYCSFSAMPWKACCPNLCNWNPFWPNHSKTLCTSLVYCTPPFPFTVSKDSILMINFTNYYGTGWIKKIFKLPGSVKVQRLGPYRYITVDLESWDALLSFPKYKCGEKVGELQ